MPQKSKKNVIAEAVLPLLLENGIKGTSIDKVVQVSGVSKPTVYNHFPDKSALVLEVIQYWLAKQPKPVIVADLNDDLEQALQGTWLTETTLRLYGLFAGEGARAPEAAKAFYNEFDQQWRQALAAWSADQGLAVQELDGKISALILQSLLQPKSL